MFQRGRDAGTTMAHIMASKVLALQEVFSNHSRRRKVAQMCWMINGGEAGKLGSCLQEPVSSGNGTYSHVPVYKYFNSEIGRLNKTVAGVNADQNP